MLSIECALLQPRPRKPVEHRLCSSGSAPLGADVEVGRVQTCTSEPFAPANRKCLWLVVMECSSSSSYSVPLVPYVHTGQFNLGSRMSLGSISTCSRLLWCERRSSSTGTIVRCSFSMWRRWPQGGGGSEPECRRTLAPSPIQRTLAVLSCDRIGFDFCDCDTTVARSFTRIEISPAPDAAHYVLGLALTPQWSLCLNSNVVRTEIRGRPPMSDAGGRRSRCKEDRDEFKSDQT